VTYGGNTSLIATLFSSLLLHCVHVGLLTAESFLAVAKRYLNFPIVGLSMKDFITFALQAVYMSNIIFACCVFHIRQTEQLKLAFKRYRVQN